ncbi:MAG: indole-3-glycerol phosphate synthase [Candidatus Marinamargulisbacteria bacterium]|jgi:indole-3-glycerol phosphate synthase
MMARASAFLEKIVEEKKKEITELHEKVGISFFKHQTVSLPKKNLFYRALSRPGLALIAEVKKASPSKGVIREDFDPLALAVDFEKRGASAISVLTEKNYFLGHPDFLKGIKTKVSAPLLRKDFIFDPIQVYESKFLGADAILLIKALLPNSDCQELIDLATDLGLDVLLEVHDEIELEDALTLKNVKIIGVNNRDLKTFDVDKSLAVRLISLIKQSSDSILCVAESGYATIGDLTALKAQNIDAVLIGEGLAKVPEMMDFFLADI